MDLDAHWATAHSTHSSVVHPLLLDVEQIDLGVDYSRGIFHNFWLAFLHLPLVLFSLHLPLQLIPISSCRSAGYSRWRPGGRVHSGSVSEPDCTVAHQRCSLSPEGATQSAQAGLRVGDMETERIHRQQNQYLCFGAKTKRSNQAVNFSEFLVWAKLLPRHIALKCATSNKYVNFSRHLIILHHSRID